MKIILITSMIKTLMHQIICDYIYLKNKNPPKLKKIKNIFFDSTLKSGFYIFNLYLRFKNLLK